MWVHIPTPHRLVPIKELVQLEEDNEVETNMVVAIAAMNLAPVYPDPPEYSSS